MVEVIAEIGKNFVTTEEEQSLPVLLDNAKKLIDAAKETGVKTVKFQVHAEDEIHPEAKLISPHFNQDRLEWVKRNTYPAEWWFSVKEYCNKVGLEFLATPMSRDAAELLNSDVGIDRWKIGSGDILDFVMLDYIRDSNKPIILSSGMSTFEELKMSYDYLKEKADDISILHCVSQYPCPIQELNLATITFLKEQFPGVKIGFSDHSVGVEGAFIAAYLGAEIIEKHFTLDRDAWGPDHKVSAIPTEMSEIIEVMEYRGLLKRYLQRWVKIYPSIIGSETKYLQESEKQFRPIFRKGLYASRNLRKGEMYEPDMILAMRPKLQVAEPSEKYENFLGKWVERDIKKYRAI